MYNEKPSFDEWKRLVIRVMQTWSWTEKAIESVDWEVFKHDYYDFDYEPEETVKQEELVV
jgi:hypothetical protein